MPRHRRESASDPLSVYHTKRDFTKTPEPRGGVARSPPHPLAFVIQKHDATALHYDFRLELDAVMLSWAVPKGPSLDPADKRLAMRTEDHPLSYNSFEGTIPEGHYGAGNVIVWDRGTWHPVGDARAGLAAGKLEFTIESQKLAGRWELIRTSGGDDARERWLLFKKRDAHARPRADYDVTLARPESVASGRVLAPRGEAMPPVGMKPATAPSPTPRSAVKRTSTHRARS